jgi:hypothetical protein
MLELIDQMTAGAAWYGSSLPTHQAVCLLGSVAQSASIRPYVHNAYFGKQAYEAFHTFVYLEDILRFRRFGRLIQPTFLIFYLVIETIKTDRVQFLELGSTLYAAFEKFVNAQNFLADSALMKRRGSMRRRTETDLVSTKIDFLGVELSGWFRELSRMLHPTVPIELFSSLDEVPAGSIPRVAFSLGVGNYAFTSAEEFAAWVVQNRFTIVRERFTLSKDFAWQIMGKRFTCFGLPEFARSVGARGHLISLLSFVEAPPFLEATEAPAADCVFVDAYLAIHALKDSELQHVSRSVRWHALDRLDSNFNTNPSIAIDADVLSRDISTLWAQPWTRNYSKTPGREVQDRQQAEPARFDFHSEFLSNELDAHIERLKMIYGVSVQSEAKPRPR